jgi:crotonobetainyl-CoA:carnitine CoA-transferase CaiB-like acyl-CoA transferase
MSSQESLKHTRIAGQDQAQGALSGVRVLDLSSVIFGPMASQVLADYGAEVIKIEPPQGDSTRHTGPALEPGMAAMFMGSNRSKKSVVLDLKQEQAQAALHALLQGADVLMHSMRPQKLARLGLDPDSLRKQYPRLIYVGLHGFGEDGPMPGSLHMTT